MKFQRLTAVVFSLVFSSMGIFAMQTVLVHAQDTEDGSQESITQEEQTEEAPESATFDYVAQPGDSFTKMARKAVQTYGITHEVNMSQAKIVCAETHITVASGSPILNEGQPVSIEESLVKTWVDNCQNLTAEQEAAWQVYVPYVNFNTDHVGQAS